MLVYRYILGIGCSHIIAPLSVEIFPRQIVADVGKSATLNCSYSGYPIVSLDWVHNGQAIVTNARVRLLSREVLHIARVERGDRGMYQCVVSNDLDSVQATAQLNLGGIICLWLPRF